VHQRPHEYWRKRYCCLLLPSLFCELSRMRSRVRAPSSPPANILQYNKIQYYSRLARTQDSKLYGGFPSCSFGELRVKMPREGPQNSRLVHARITRRGEEGHEA
jgi:hypothetical protein